MVYIDESGIQKYLYKERGYAKKGKRYAISISGRRYSKENFVARS
ncbi:hypothetical protein MIDIC_70082 [Alphaproteobacteria bacterium]